MRRTIFAAVCVAAAGGVFIPFAAHGQLPAAVFDGRPTYKEGKALGYFIWRDGDTWKVRWMTFGAEHRFTGRIVVDGRQIASFKRIDVDEERKVIRPGQAPTVVRGPRGRVRGVRGGRAPVVAERTEDRIEQENEHTVQWLTQTDDDIDGIDVKVTESSTTLRFFLMIDGEPKPGEVEVGKENVKPDAHPLRVALK